MKYILNTPSKEQQDIINAIINKNNVVVNAVAGSGKTTTILSLAKQLSNKKILLLTYNTKLKDETQNKLNDLGFQNLDIYTFHGFASKLFKRSINQDTKLRQFINEFNFDTPKIQYDIVCLDEMQDCTPLLFELITKIFYSIKNKVQWLILGDSRQCIYKYNEADARFLSMFDKLFNINAKHLSLTTNFRCSKNICNFWNNFCKNENDYKLTPGINNNNNNPVVYLSLADSYDVRQIIDLIIDLKKEYGYKDDDFFILSNSVKSYGKPKPITILFEACKNKNLNVYAPSSDDEEIQEEMIQNKIVFSSFHQAKGRERKVVFIINFDNSLYKYFYKNSNPNVCPNELYVAITRAQEHLILVEGKLDNSKYSSRFNFISTKKLEKDKSVYFIEHKNRSIIKDKFQHETLPTIFNKSVTELTKNLKSSTVLTIEQLLKPLTTESTKSKTIKITNTFKNISRNIKEDVSFINAHVLLAKFLLEEFNIQTIFTNSERVFSLIVDNLGDIKEYNEILKQNPNISFLQKLILDVIFITSHLDKRVYLTKQINAYNWLDDFNDYDKIKERLLNLLQKNVDTDQELEIELSLLNQNAKNKEKITKWLKQFLNKYEFKEFNILGRLDLINGKTLLELKCTTQTKIEHLIQLVLYMWMNNVLNQYNFDKYILFNMLTNEKIEIKNEPKTINLIAKTIIESKIDAKTPKLSNDEFIDQYQIK